MTIHIHGPRDAITAEPGARGTTQPTMLPCRIEVIDGHVVALHLDATLKLRIDAGLRVTMSPRGAGADRVPA